MRVKQQEKEEDSGQEGSRQKGTDYIIKASVSPVFQILTTMCL